MLIKIYISYTFFYFYIGKKKINVCINNNNFLTALYLSIWRATRHRRIFIWYAWKLIGSTCSILYNIMMADFSSYWDFSTDLICKILSATMSYEAALTKHTIAKSPEALAPPSGGTGNFLFRILELWKTRSFPPVLQSHPHPALHVSVWLWYTWTSAESKPVRCLFHVSQQSQ